ncbi:MAG TPA: Uma2 family endonuclease, partial [Coleofasciculaceae cyanobacterium]
MPKGPPPSEKRLVLENVSWQQYEDLLSDLNRDRKARLTYTHGQLEMMTPLEEHERCHKLVESFILVLADEMGLAVEGFEAPTLKRSDLQLGTEPDTAYYIQQAHRVKGRSQIDLMVDPFPDLILEVSLNKSEIEKFPLYAAMGIPE